MDFVFPVYLIKIKHVKKLKLKIKNKNYSFLLKPIKTKEVKKLNNIIRENIWF